MSSSRIWLTDPSGARAAAVLLFGSLSVSAACWLNWPAFLRGTSRHGGGWLWRYYEQPREPGAFALTLTLFALAVWLLERRARRGGGRLAAAGVCFFVLLVQFAALTWAQDGDGNAWRAMAAHQLSAKGTGTFQAIEDFPDLRPVFRDWPRVRANLPPPHVPYQPPFVLLPAWISVRLAEAYPSLSFRIAAVTRIRRDAPSPLAGAAGLFSALLILAACALNPLLLTRLLQARQDPHPLATAALAAIVPGILIHAPTAYQLQAPFFTASAFAAQSLALPWGALAAGAWIGCASELSFLAPALGNWVAVVVWARGRDARQSVLSWVALLAGVLVVLLAAQAATGFSWFGGLFAVLASGHPEEILNRPYAASLWRNLVDVIVWCGPLPFAGALLGGVAALSNLLRGKTPDGFALGALVGIAVLNASGATRAEVGRVWMPYFPLLAVAAAPTLRQMFPNRWLAGAAGAQLVHTFVLLSRWGS